MTPGAERPSICIFAAKDLRLNTRVFRQASALAAAGWQVTVAALELPVPRLRERTPTVEYLRVPTPHPLQALAALRRPRAPRTARSQPAATPAATRDPPPVPRWLALARRLALPCSERISRELFARGCARLLRGRRFDVCQAHDAAALRAAARCAGRGALVYDALEFVDDRPQFARGALARALRRLESAAEARLIARADLVFAIGPSMRDWMVSRYRIAPPLLLRNCREFSTPDGARRLRADLGLAAGQQLVLFANSIAPGEGVEQFIAALALLPAHVHGAVLGPARDLEFRQGLARRAQAAGVGARMHFPTPCGPDEVVDYFAGADVGVIPRQNTSRNHYCSLPNRLFEMIMARLPLAASDFPDFRSVIATTGVGLLFDETDPASIAAALAELLDTTRGAVYRQRLEDAARELCWENESRGYLAALAALRPGARGSERH